MRVTDDKKTASPAFRRHGGARTTGVLLLAALLAVQGCFSPVYPQVDREVRVMEALDQKENRPSPPSPLTASAAVVYALHNNLDARVVEIEMAYWNESAVAARRRLLPTLNLRYSMDHSNHPSARWSESTRSGNQSLESSYSSDPNSRHAEVSMMWSILDFGVGYLKSRQQEERIRHSGEQRRRIRQQVVLDVLSAYWRTAAAIRIADEAEQLRKELEDQAEAIRDSVEMRILTGAEGARRELVVHSGLAELEQWRRAATQARLELVRIMGAGNNWNLVLEPLPEEVPALPPLPGNDPSALQAAAIRRRPELYQQDAQERIAVDEARIALLQMAPNANLSLSLHDDPDKFLEWRDWMTVGARVSWNLLSIPSRLAERRMAKLQEDVAKQKGLALAAAIMAQVGIAFSEWRLSHEYATILTTRAKARGRLVEALAAGERDGQTRPGEVLQERVRLLSEKAASYRAMAEARVAGARLANAIGLDVDDCGRLVWSIGDEEGIDLLRNPKVAADRAVMAHSDTEAARMLPRNISGMRVVKAEDFEAPADYFEKARRAPTPPTDPKKPAPPEKENAGDARTASGEEPSGEKRESEEPKPDMAAQPLAVPAADAPEEKSASHSAWPPEVPDDPSYPSQAVLAADMLSEPPAPDDMSLSLAGEYDANWDMVDLEQAWMRLDPGEFQDESLEKLGALAGLPGALPGKTEDEARPEEYQSLAPSDPNAWWKAPQLRGGYGAAPGREDAGDRKLPYNHFERMRALEPLPVLPKPQGSLKPPSTLDESAGTLRPPGSAETGASLRPQE